MGTVQITIEESLLFQATLERALRQRKIIELEIRDAKAYAANPQRPEEIAEWESEQHWDEP